VQYQGCDATLESNWRRLRRQLSARLRGRTFCIDLSPPRGKNEIASTAFLKPTNAVTRRASYNPFTWIALGGWLLAAAPADAQQPAILSTGAAFQQRLNEPVTLTWQDRGLRDGLARLSQAYGVAIFLDRRIDPQQELTLSARDETLEMLLRRIARDAQAAAATVGAVIYIGPSPTASRLATLAAIRRQDVAKLPGDARARLLRAQAWEWPELSQPRQLLQDLAREAEVTVENSDVLPLDLWPAVRLPPMPWTDRLTLLLAGFEMTYEIGTGGKVVRVVGQPAAAVLEKTYTSQGNVASLASQLARLLPDAKIRLQDQKLLVSASQEDHEKIERLLSGHTVRGTKSVKKGGEKLYSLEVENQPASKVVRSIAESLGKPLKAEPPILEKLNQPVTFKLENATLDHLLSTTLQPLALTYRLTEDTLEVVKEKPSP
jgi:hypothetical protein